MYQLWFKKRVKPPQASVHTVLWIRGRCFSDALKYIWSSAVRSSLHYQRLHGKTVCVLAGSSLTKRKYIPIRTRLDWFKLWHILNVLNVLRSKTLSFSRFSSLQFDFRHARMHMQSTSNSKVLQFQTCVNGSGFCVHD